MLDTLQAATLAQCEHLETCLDLLSFAVHDLHVTSLLDANVELCPVNFEDFMKVDHHLELTGALDLESHILQVLLSNLDLNTLELLCIQSQVSTHLLAIVIGLSLLFNFLLIHQLAI